MLRSKRSVATLTLALAISACGGSAPATPPTGGVAPSAVVPTAVSGGDPSAAAQSQPAAVASVPTSGGGGGGGGGVCDLVTIAELETIFAVTAVTTAVIAGPPDTCDIQENSAPLAGFVLTPTGGAMVFDLLAGGGDAQRVDGIGDAAFYSASTLLLAIKRGDAMLSIAVLDEGRPEAARLELMKQLGAIAAGRM